MGWKSTKVLTRKKAIELIEHYLYNASNEELSDALEGIGYGDNVNLDYHGCNFIIVDTEDEIKKFNN
jgi:hypothetical protein